MKKRLIEYVKTYLADRCDVDAVLTDLEESGFYEAWASTTFHCNYEGGLLEHTLNVTIKRLI